MKKDCVLYITLILFSFVLFSSNVDAVVKVVDDYAYSLEELNITCDSLNLSTPLYAADRGFAFNMYDDEEKYDIYYWTGNSNCPLLTDQEKLDTFNKSSISYAYDEIDNKLYEYNGPITLRGGYFLTKDTVALEGKRYYEKTGTYNFSPIYYLEEGADVTSYYERTSLSRPSSTVIDNNLKYYTLENNIVTLVENPVSENIIDYFFIYDKNNYRKVVNKYPKSEVDNFVDDYIDSLSNATKISRHIMKIGDELYIFLSYYEDGDRSNSTVVFFNEDYELVPEFTNKKYDTYGNFIVQSEYDNRIYRIYDKKFNLLFTLNEENANKILTANEKNDVMLLTFSSVDTYLLTRYSVINGDNLVYNNQDLAIRFNGFTNTLKNVKVNDVLLDEENYTHEFDKTVILKQSYLKNLLPGTYKLRVEYTDDGYSEATFIVKEPNPKTGDTIINMLLIGVISIICLFTVIINLKDKNIIKV